MNIRFLQFHNHKRQDYNQTNTTQPSIWIVYHKIITHNNKKLFKHHQKPPKKLFPRVIRI